MSGNIPNSVIGAAASVIAGYYYSHSKLDTLFMESGVPGDAPEGNCERKCSEWLKRCNEAPEVDALEVLGRVIQNYMDQLLQFLFLTTRPQESSWARSVLRRLLSFT